MCGLASILMTTGERKVSGLDKREKRKETNMERKRIWKRVLSSVLVLAMVVTSLTISPREAKAAGNVYDISDVKAGIAQGASLNVSALSLVTGTKILEYGDEVIFKVSMEENARLGIGYGSYGVYFYGNTNIRYCNDLTNTSGNLGRGSDNLAVSGVTANTLTRMKLKIEEQDASYMKLTLTIYANDEDATGTSYTIADIPRKTGTEDTLHFHAINTLSAFSIASTVEPTYNEMWYGHWSENLGTEGVFLGTVYGLPAGTLTSLDGVAISGNVKFESTSRLHIGSTESVKHGGFWLWKDDGGLHLSPQGIGGDGGDYYAIHGDTWTAVKDTTFLLRLTFDNVGTGWAVGIYVNDVYFQTLTYKGVTTALEPGLLIDIEEGVSVDMTVPTEEYTEMWYGHWSENLGTDSVFNGTVYGLPEGTLSSLDGVAISGDVNFSTTGKLRIGGTESCTHGGFWLWNDGSGLHLSPQGIGGDGGDYYAISGDAWAAIKDTTFLLRLTFDKVDTGWEVGIYANNTYIQTLIYVGVTTALEPGLLLGIEEGVTVDMTVSGGTVSKEYTTLTFSDWGLKDGTYSEASRNFALKDESITSLDGYAFEGYVNYHGTGSYLKVAGIDSNPHYALQVWAVTSSQIAMVNHLNLDNGQPIFAPEGYSASEYAKIRVTFDETQVDTWTIGLWVNDTHMGDMHLTGTALGTKMLYGGSAISVKSTVSGLDYDNNVNYEEYMTPIWKGTTVYDESVMPLYNQDGSMSPITLAYAVNEIVSVKSADLQTTYTAGTDYTVENGKLVIPSGSAIPVTQYSEYYFDTPTGNAYPTTDGGYMYFSEDGWFHDRQIVVTYTHSDTWGGSVPKKQGQNLTNVQEKLENKEPITVAFYGDSITEGANSSAFLKKKPRLETYAELTVEAMRRTYGYEEIYYVNTALGGQTTAWGAENAQNRVAMHEPDLLFIAFGMNDPVTLEADYKASIESIINTVRADNADCDIVLVGTMLPNEEAGNNTYGNQVEFVNVLNTIAGEYSNVVVADMTNMHKSLLEMKSYRDMTGNNVNHPNDFLGRVYAQVLIETIDVRTAEDDYTELSFADWDNFVEYNSLVKGNVYSLSNNVVTSLNGVAISGKVNFATEGVYLRIGGRDAVKHGGFWMWKAGNGLHLSPQGIGETAAWDKSVVSGDTWEAVKDSYFELRMTFDKVDNGWTIGVYVNGELTFNETIEQNLTPGLYIGIGAGIYVDMVDEDETYQELTFADWDIYDGIVPYPNEHKDYLHKLKYENITNLAGYALTGTIAFDGGYWRIGTHEDSTYYGLQLQVNGSTLQMTNWLDATPTPIDLYTFVDNEAIASKVPIRIEFESVSSSAMRIHVYVNNSHKRTLDLTINAQVSGSTVQAGTNLLSSNTNGTMKVYSDKKTYKELTFSDYEGYGGSASIGFLLKDGEIPTGESIYVQKYNWKPDLNGCALTGRITFGSGSFRFAGTNSGGFHGVEISLNGNDLRFVNHKNLAETNSLPALYSGDDTATREFLIRIEFDEVTDTKLAFTIYLEGIMKQSYVFTNTLADYPFGAALYFNNPDGVLSVKSVENAAKVFEDGIYVKDLTKSFVLEKDAVLINGHLRTEYSAGSKVTLGRGIYQMFYKEQMTLDTCDIYAYVQGDLNVDESGVCSSADLVRAKKALKDQKELSTLGLIAGDFNLNGAFEETDLKMLRMHMLSAGELVMLQRPAADSTVDLLGDALNSAVESYTTESWGAIDTLNPEQADICDTNEITLAWVAIAGATYKVYVSEQKDMSDAVVYKTDEATLKLYNLIPGTTYYWKVKAICADDTKVTSDVMAFTTKDGKIRTIVIDGVPNTRDIGGLTSADGTKRIKYGMLYRGGKANYITELGESQAAMLGVRTELDLRANNGEAVDTKSFGENVNYINIPGVHYSLQVEDNWSTIVEELRVFADVSAYPVYFHCSLGRDRTGTLAFLLEALAGVSEDDLMLDYELSRLSYIGSVTATNEELLPNYMNMYNVINTYAGDTFQEKTWNYLKTVGLTETEIALIYDNITEDVTQESEEGYERMTLYYGLAEPCKEFDASNAESYVTKEFTAEVAGGFGVSTYRIWLPALAYTRVAEEGSTTAVGGYEIAFYEEQLATAKDWVAQLQANGVKQILLCQSNFVVLDDQPFFILDDGSAVSQKDIREKYGNAYPPGTKAVYADSAAVPEFGTEKYEQFLAVQQAYYDMLTDAIPGITHIEAINEPEGNAPIHRFGGSFTHDNWNTPASYTTDELARACMDYCYAINQGVAGKNVKVLTPALMTVENNEATGHDTSALLKAFYDYIAGNGETKTFEDTIIDHYFQILNWHPYVHLAGTDATKQVVSNKADWDSWYDGKGTDMEWVDYQNMLYQIALDAGDYNTPVWFSEFGVTDVYGNAWGNFVGGVISEQDAAERFEKMMELVQSDLKFVQAITTFRISDWKPTADNNVEHTECSYGMLESFLLENSADACLKPIGETYYEIINGVGADKEKLLAVICKYYNAFNAGTSPGALELVDFVVEVEEGREPVILQLTDTQIIDPTQDRRSTPLNELQKEYWALENMDERLYDSLTETIDETQPDLILLTGDLVYGEFDDNGSMFKSLIDKMESFGIPWAPVFGNHDNESAMGVDWQCQQLEAAEHCLFKQRTLTGNGNYTVGIKQGGVLKRVFFMMDSNGCGAMSASSIANGHSTTSVGFGQDQMDWSINLAKKIKNISPNTKISYAFHIQIMAFEEAYAKYGFTNSATANNPINIDKLANKAEGDFGYIGRDLKSPWDTNDTFFNRMKAVGVDSIFVGHEHCNSASVVYDGIRFQYGQKIGTYDRTNFVTESGVIQGGYLLDSLDTTLEAMSGGTVMKLSESDGTIVDAYIYLCGDAQAKLDGTYKAPEQTTAVNGLQYGEGLTKDAVMTVEAATIANENAWKCTATSQGKVYVDCSLLQNKTKFTFSVYVPSESTTTMALFDSPLFAIRVKPNESEPALDGNANGYIEYSTSVADTKRKLLYGQWQTFTVDVTGLGAVCTEFAFNIGAGNVIYLKDVAFE